MSGPSSFSEAITSSEAFVGLTPGPSTVSASTVSFEGIEYEASVSGSPATVTDGGTATATVAFAATSTEQGDLIVTITGLPGGVEAHVDVTAPSGTTTPCRPSGLVMPCRSDSAHGRSRARERGTHRGFGRPARRAR